MARFLGLDEDDLIAQYDLAISEQNFGETYVKPPAPEESAKAPQPAVSSCWGRWV